MKTVSVPNGILHLSESKAVCPYCERKIPWSELEDRWIKSDGHFRMKDKCKRFIGITMNIKGDFIAYEL